MAVTHWHVPIEKPLLRCPYMQCWNYQTPISSFQTRSSKKTCNLSFRTNCVALQNNRDKLGPAVELNLSIFFRRFRLRSRGDSPQHSRPSQLGSAGPLVVRHRRRHRPHHWWHKCHPRPVPLVGQGGLQFQGIPGFGSDVQMRSLTDQQKLRIDCCPLHPRQKNCYLSVSTQKVFDSWCA